MEVTVGKDGLKKTWQKEFPETTECCHLLCNGIARIGFVAHEGMSNQPTPVVGEKPTYVCNLHPNEGKGGYWPHDCISCALYICRDCFKVTAIMNQG